MRAEENGRRMAGLNARAVRYLLDRDPSGAQLAATIEAARAAYGSVTYCPRHRPPFGSEPARVYRAHPPRPDGFACDCGPSESVRIDQVATGGLS